MIDSLIRIALRNRLLVVSLSMAILIYGAWVGYKMSIDVFPDLNRPRVTVITEAHGLAPDEVETLVTIPLESVLNGTPRVTGIRSSSGIGLSIIYVDFDWGTDIYRNRQLVAERLQLAKSNLPDDIQPVMGPISSLMGEIQFVGMISENDELGPLDLRTIADWTVRPRLMSIPGISQVIVMGGGVKEYQILISSAKLQKKGLSVDDLRETLKEISANSTGGFLNKDNKEYLIRPLGRVSSKEDIENTTIGTQFGKAVRLREVAQVEVLPKIKRGDSSVNGKPSVVLTIQKQPEADTVSVTKQVEFVLNEMRGSMPRGVSLRTDLFKQSDFIERAIENVIEALRDGTIIVAIVIFLFLLNMRTTAITLTAIPMSFVISLILFKWLGLNINTMTLGGLAIAVGELVDDAIVDVENVFRRLRENSQLVDPKNPLLVVYHASKEVRSSIVVSTMIVVAVFVPLFALDGLEGRFFTPMGMAYILSLLASLFVSLTLTPVLCYLLLPQSKVIKEESEPVVVKKIKNFFEPLLIKGMSYWKQFVFSCVVLFFVAVVFLLKMQSNFMPHFNEGTATIGIASYPGISLPASSQLGMTIEKEILKIPEVRSTIRRTGRAEMDEHAEGVHWNEIDVDFKHPLARPMETVLGDIRETIQGIDPNVYVNIGQPISHRIDHMMSGVRAQLAIKVFGSDPVELRRYAVDIENILNSMNGLVDVQIEPLVKVPQLFIQVDRDSAAENNLSPGHIAEDLQMGLRGEYVGNFIDGQKIFGIFARFDEDSRSKIENINGTILSTLPSGKRVMVSDVADVYETTGPNMINREGMQRRLVVSANSPKRALTDVVAELKEKLKSVNMETGYYTELGGQYESQTKAQQKILVLGLISLVVILLILYMQFHSMKISVLVLVNIPLALIGSVFAIKLTGLDLSLATTVAFITLCGIACRNSVLVLNHYLDLLKNGMPLRTAVMKGSLERLIPVLMTAGTAILALTPLALSRGEAGKEILFPVAVVIIGGLITSTLLNTLLVPALFQLFSEEKLKELLSQINKKEII